jgi:2-succinyl-5-enolpyruvyl-6-hydroxy-3-cyclohexene-1-carboxylate synthase
MRKMNMIPQRLAEILVNSGVEDVVICPGSRNAPLVQSFGVQKGIRKHSIVDERSAGFFAMGLSLKTQQPTVLVSTSGTAALNFSPAIAEAYYQKIPLLILTADRPDFLIDQGDGQSLRQNGIYDNFIVKSYHLSHRLVDENDIRFADRLINEAYFLASSHKGPVHLNLPFVEPLYSIENKEDISQKSRKITAFPSLSNLDESAWNNLRSRWNQAERKMIIIGQGECSQKTMDNLTDAVDDSCIIISETLSNMQLPHSISGIDKLLASIPDAQSESFMPDLLITTGGAIVSKKIKSFLRSASDYMHWHIDEKKEYMDTYLHLTHQIPVSFGTFLQNVHFDTGQTSDYRNKWMTLKDEVEKKHSQFMKDCPWTDLKVFDVLLDRIPKTSILHLGNSTVVRYAQLFEHARDFSTFSNRGTSGIDGSISTAVGYATLSNKENIVISGDLSFFYDSNALMNQHFPDNLKIIVINNQGGNIFRFIQGPSDTGFLEKFFEVKHNYQAKSLAESFHLEYYFAKNEKELIESLDIFLSANKGGVLEIFTPNEESASILKKYFAFLS